MIIVPISIYKMEMNDFDVRTNTAHLAFQYNDGVNRVLEKKLVMENTESLAGTLLTELRDTAKKNNMERAREEEDFLIIKFAVEEEESERRIKAFLDRAADRIKGLRQTRVATGYLDRLSNSKKLSIDFNPKSE